MKGLARCLVILALAGAAAGVLIYACSRDDDKAALGEFRDSFMDFVEGRDENALLKYVPDDLGRFEITMDSGKTQMSPESLDDLETIFEDTAYVFSGDSVTILQSNETLTADGAVMSFTVRVTDGAMVSTIPVKVRLLRDPSGKGWVMRSMELFN
jgi:hypothetical protein